MLANKHSVFFELNRKKTQPNTIFFGFLRLILDFGKIFDAYIAVIKTYNHKKESNNNYYYINH